MTELLSTVRPPTTPVFTPTHEDWKREESKLDIRFPVDYFSVVSAYGSGAFLGGEFRVLNPIDPRDTRSTEDELARLKEIKHQLPLQIPFDVHPARPGLYPFAIDGNGNTFLWLTDGKPDSWPIVCLNSEDSNEVSTHSLSSFITLLSQDEIDIRVEKFWGEIDKLTRCEFVPRKAKKGR